jgi:hypothetical protein
MKEADIPTPKKPAEETKKDLVCNYCTTVLIGQPDGNLLLLTKQMARLSNIKAKIERMGTNDAMVCDFRF